MDHIHVCQTGKGAQLLPPKKHLLHIGHILQDKVTNVEVLSCAGLPTMHTLLRQCQVHWLGHVHHMEDGHIPKVILLGELATGQRSIGCLQLRFKDVCKRDMRTLDINTESWEDLAADSGSWKNTFHKQLMLGKEKLIVVEDEQRARRKDPTTRPETTHRCNPATETFPQSDWPV